MIGNDDIELVLCLQGKLWWEFGAIHAATS